ncbi:MAG: 7-cyano-7-deazaguanine synthase QueC [Candidatus Krumholzibacteria bacterium]|nr:7-cyano-7-deazaguanine synthase QueC [Candidatus Krumholzibacteria bacterium]
MQRAVCLVSGGLDSCVSAAVAHSLGLKLAFLHISYGQLAAKREEEAFTRLADHYQVSERLVSDITHLSQIGGSALTDPSLEVPEGELDREGIPVSYVPFRNANMLAIATSWAEVLGSGSIYIGAVQEDSSGYPDCRESFFSAFTEVIEKGTRPDTSIQIVTPLIHFRKKEIVEEGMKLGAPFHLTWSCYRDQEISCGRCDSCLLRLRGFQEAGVPDPLPYQEIPAPQL